MQTTTKTSPNPRSLPISVAWFLVLCVLAPLGSGCYSTGPTEVGVRTVKLTLFGSRGVQKEVYAPGATYFFLPLINDWNTFDTRLQNLEMVKDHNLGDRRYQDDLRFKTRDGNDISVDVTVAWRINPQKSPRLLQYIGDSLGSIKDRLVRPTCRAIVRDVLNELSSEDFYVAAKRRTKADKARAALRKSLQDEGIIIEQVILKEYRFNARYQKIIQARKLAEQQAEALKSEARAAYERASRDFKKAQGTVHQKIARALGQFAQLKYRADAHFLHMEQNAKSQLVEAKARARAITERNKALAGSGGKTLVKLQIAKALQGKKIILLPLNQRSGVGVQTLDVNELLKVVLSKTHNKYKQSK